MTLRSRFGRWLIGLSTLAGLACLSSCSSDYSYFTVDMSLDGTVSVSTRDHIGTCTLTIMNETLDADHPVEKYTLTQGKDDRGNTYGCGSGMTSSSLGKLNYSAMRTSGTLTFLLQAFETDGKLLAKGQSSAFGMNAGSVQLVQLSASVVD